MKKATADEMLVAENLQTALFTNDIASIETMIANRTNLNVMFFFLHIIVIYLL